MDIIIQQGTRKIGKIGNANAVPSVGDKILIPGYMLIVDTVIWHMDYPNAWVEVQVR